MIKDMMGSENYEFITEDFMVQIIFGLIYTTYDSISLTLTVALKLLEENPAVLKEMTVSIMLLYFNLYVCM